MATEHVGGTSEKCIGKASSFTLVGRNFLDGGERNFLQGIGAWTKKGERVFKRGVWPKLRVNRLYSVQPAVRRGFVQG